MIRASIGKSKRQSADPTTVQAGESGYLISDPKHQAKKPVPFLRVLGNLLILSGVLLLLGIGGWWGFTTWDNQRTVERMVATGVSVEPTIDPSFLADATEAPPTASPTVVIAFQSLNKTPTPLTPLLGIIPTVTPVRDDSPPVRITIPSVKIDSKIVPITWNMIPKPGGGMRSEWDVASYAVGHHAGSSNPGQPGNVVMSGHVDYKGEVFKELHNVKKGDEVVLQTEKGQYMYVITDLVLVKEDGVDAAHKRANAHYMDQTAQPTLTLITCFPYGIDDHRFIAIGHPYQPETNSQSEFSLR